MMKMRCLRALIVAASAVFWLEPAFTRAESYDLERVKGMEAFGGSAAAKELLRKNGFVVADPAFRQIFEAYIESPAVEAPSVQNPRGRSLPSFITTDSAWHTYHVLLEEGVKQMEGIQASRLLDFSRRLLAAANDPKTGDRDLVLFASIAVALQDEHYRASFSPEATGIVEGLLNSSTPVQPPVGFPLSPLQFRAQSFYTQSPELSGYFAARQWYGSVLFRLSSVKETKSALTLAAVVNGNEELLALWHQLSDPYDEFVASAEDGTIHEYGDAAKAVLGINSGLATDNQIAEIQRRLEAKLPFPRVSDQLLSPEQYAEFPTQTRGFRLLPPRRLPCAVCFHETVDPKIPGRKYPSGLDYLASSPVLRSAAAVRAVEGEFGKGASELILKADGGPMPDSLHGEAMNLLAVLQNPLPETVPPALQTEAWSDLQLWTQLGAWAEQKHTWALHTKLSVNYLGIVTPPDGMVAPYPEFFSGLAQLARRTAKAFDKAGQEPRFEVKEVANELSELIALYENSSGTRDEKELEKQSEKLEQFSQFQNRYYGKHRDELANDTTGAGHKKLKQDLADLAKRCAQSGVANEAETETLKSFFDCRQSLPQLLNDFAPVCDQLAALAKKTLAREPLTEDDAKWIRQYGITLAGFHFYYGDSYEVPLDNFPMVTRVFSSPVTGSMFYAGLARPQALYVIATNGDSLQLYRGAVLAYREFARPNDQLLDDESWRELIGKGQTPPAPPFTRTFYAETGMAELLKRLVAQSVRQNVNYSESRDLLWQIGTRAAEKDLPALLDTLVQEYGDEQTDIVDGLSGIISSLPWPSQQTRLIGLLAGSDQVVADASARILCEPTESLDVPQLVSGFPSQPPRTRRLYCVILSRATNQTEVTRQLLLRALSDKEEGVRWQAAFAIEKSGWKAPAAETALVEALNDANDLVGAAAAYSLAKLGATNTGPALREKLKARLQSTNLSPAGLERQVLAITRDSRETMHDNVLDVDNLRFRIRLGPLAGIRGRENLRLPPRPLEFPMHHYNLADALIEALGDLKYAPAADDLFKLMGTDYEIGATVALGKLAPDRLAGQLLATAKDDRLDSYLRERALATLGNLAITNHVREIIPLLDDVTPIVYSRPSPIPEWRICDRAATTIAVLLGWQHRSMLIFFPPEQREQMLGRAREWARQNL